jgi:flagellar hook-associated protein 2
MGITIDKSTGQLAINESMLDERLATNQQAVANAFANTGTSTGSGITFSALSQATKEKAYAVNITAAASQARVASVGDISVDGLGHAVITSANKTISLGVNGSLVTATLAEGSYTRAELVTQVQTAINAVIPASGSKVEARLNGNALDLHSLGYGSRQSLQVLGGSANSILNVSTAVALGADVQGTIDGQAATGLAQSLTGALGSDAEGLRLAITSTVPTSSTVTVRKGLAQRSNEALLAMTSADNGTLVNKTDELESTIEVLTKKITSADANLAVRRKRYEAQFLAMEKAISGLKNQESQLNGQIKGFENAALARSR